MLSEISQTEKDKYCMISLICGKSKIYNKLGNITKNRLTDIENKLVVTSVGRDRGWDKMGEGSKRYKLSCIK